VRYLAIIVPKKIPSTISKGVKRVFAGLHLLPDDYLIYYEPLINPRRPDIIIISPNLGLLVIEIRNWYPGQISSVSEDEVRIIGGNPRTVMHPVIHAQIFLDSIIHRSSKHPFCSSLLNQDNEQKEFRFPTGTLLFLPNCTTSQLTNHPFGDLCTLFGPKHTICRERLKDIENWDMVDIIMFLRSCTNSHGRHIPLTSDQVHAIRAIIHPDIIIEVPELGNIDQKNGPSTSLKILDFTQEKKLYQISPNHHIFFGPAGSGKTVILIARARILHNRDEDHHSLILCFSSLFSSYLQKTFSNYPRIEAYSFRQWAEMFGISRHASEGGDESDQEFGTRLFKEILYRRGNFHTYDAVFIDEGNDFCPSWFQCSREALKNPDQGDLFIVADGEKGFKGPVGVRWEDIGIHVRGHITHQGLKIDKQYRNTREILTLARLFLLPTVENDEEQSENMVLAFDSSIRSGLKPLLMWNTSHGHQAEYAVYLVQRLLGSLKSAHYLSGIKPDDIAILYPYGEMGDIHIISALIGNLGRFFPVQWVSEDLKTYERINLPGVKVHDCHSINGLYYRVVIILFAENFERFFHDSEFFSDRYLFYSALTRPLDYLIIQYTERTDIIRKILASGYVDEFTGK